MNVAIVHDILLSYGGAERDLEEILEIFPSSDLFTLYFNKNDERIKSTFGSKSPKCSFLQFFPHIYRLGQLFSITKIVSWLYFYSLGLSEYDLVISISGSYNSKFLRKVKPGRHVCYLLTPPKYLYVEKNELKFLKDFPFNILTLPFMVLLRYIDKKSATNPDILLAQSNTVRERIKKYYQRDAVVVYPPVNVGRRGSRKIQAKKKYYVFHSRLVTQKGVELVVKTCARFNLPLVVIGEGYLKNKLKKIAGNSINFLGEVSDRKLGLVYGKAIALIYSAIDEDFGIVPVEAMGFGVPVIAYRSGGVKETVIEGKTGLFFNKFTIGSLYRAIKRFKKLTIDPKECSKQAEKFDKEKFKKNIIQITREVLE